MVNQASSLKKAKTQRLLLERSKRFALRSRGARGTGSLQITPKGLS